MKKKGRRRGINKRKKKRSKEREKRRINQRRKNESKVGVRKVGNLRWRGESSKVRERSQETGSSKISQIDPGLWKESKWKDTNKKNVEPYDRDEEGICIQEKKDVFFV